MVTLAPLRAYGRFFVVLYHFLPLIVGYARDRHRFLILGPGREVSSSRRRQRATRLLDSLLTLGPTFIKLGQLLSTRPDVLPPEYIEVLTQLQDRVPPAPWEDARHVIEAELGPVETAFDEFDTAAISGASLGQVYKGKVDGQPVAVKVRRPNIESLVEADLTVVKWLLPIGIRFVGEARAFSLQNLADEFAKTIREEMDYVREAAMLREIKSNFEGDGRYRMPGVVDEYSTERVMTMEFIPGTKITDVETLDAEGHNRSRLAENLQRAYLQMVIEDGIFHADPHPGNLAVQPDGTIVFYDFGMSGRVEPFIQQRIIDFYVAVANQDIDGILDALIEMGTLSPDADRTTMGQVMELAIEDARGEAIEQYRVQQIIQQIEDTIYEFPFRLPRNLALVLRVATVVEGVCVTLDADFDFIAVATAFLTERGYRAESFRQFVAETRSDIGEAALASLRIPPKFDAALNRLERGDIVVEAAVRDSNDVIDRLAKRVVYGLVLAAAIVSGAILYPSDIRAAGVAWVLGGIALVLLYWSFREPRGIRARPQFTRQALRERRGRDE